VYQRLYLSFLKIPLLKTEYIRNPPLAFEHAHRPTQYSINAFSFCGFRHTQKKSLYYPCKGRGKYMYHLTHLCVHMILVSIDYFYVQALTKPIFLMEAMCCLWGGNWIAMYQTVEVNFSVQKINEAVHTLHFVLNVYGRFY
jgi:hypothetical protein